MIKLGKTYRRTKTRGKKCDDKDNDDFWMKHDITPIRRGLNQSLRAEEKNYFKKFKDTKYGQPPKSRGFTQ